MDRKRKSADGTLVPKLEELDEGDDGDDSDDDYERLENALALSTTPSTSTASSASPSSATVLETSNDSECTTSPPSKQAKMEVRKLKAQCEVCRGKATGHHYGVISCNACKTFFRRATTENRQFSCPRGGRCETIDSTEARLSCRACRLNLCFKSGMNQAAIQSTPAVGSKPKAVALPPLNSHNSLLLFVGEKSTRLISRELRIFRRWHRLRSSTYFPYNEELAISEHIQTRPSFTKAEQYPEMKEWPPLPERQTGTGFKELLIAQGHKLWLWLDVFLCIDYLKTLPFFDRLGACQQLDVAWKTCIPLLMLSSSYFAKKEGYSEPTYPNGVVIKNLPLFRFFGHYIDVFDILNRTSMDETQFALLMRLISLIALEQSALDKSVGDEVKCARAAYNRSLREYTLTSIGDHEKGSVHYSELLLSLNEVAARANMLRDAYVLMLVSGRKCNSSRFIYETFHRPERLATALPIEASMVGE